MQNCEGVEEGVWATHFPFRLGPDLDQNSEIAFTKALYVGIQYYMYVYSIICTSMYTVLQYMQYLCIQYYMYVYSIICMYVYSNEQKTSILLVKNIVRQC